ncbi:MAG TPA: hypothetical protein VMI54_15840 [Polyangiaceae bacterium]|nr:hypothetical protein [Polyangiaceae bacterium]
MSHADYIKQLLRAAKMSQVQASVLADVSPVSWRVYMANPELVSEPVRARCEAVERSLEQTTKGLP